MQWFPPLVVDGTSWRLPLSDRASVILARVLCSDESDDAIDLLVKGFRNDPVLTLWSVCQAKLAGHEPRDTASLAAWLLPRLTEPADWPVDDQEVKEALPDDFVQEVCRSDTRAIMARLLAEKDGEQATEEVFLAALLHQPHAWLQHLGHVTEDVIRSFNDLLPSWLTQPDVLTYVDQAIQRLDHAAESPCDPDIERSQFLGGATLDYWMTAIPLASVPIGQLISRLSRLKSLENDYQKTLEAEKLEAMTEFGAGAGHEINNPLAVIAGRAQLLLQEETDPERRRALALMNVQAKRVYEMIADMMLFARPPAPHFEQVDLLPLVDQLVERLQPRMAEQAVELQRVGRDEPIFIDADPAQLNVALQAMCQNSLEAIGHDGRIEIELAETDRSAVIRVRDNGPGISDEARRHLFDPYYSERQAGRGLGLGLSKCWRIVVTNHRGTINVESRPGQPTIFTITLLRRQKS